MENMNGSAPLDQTLCLKFCSYYKPGKNEELACRGYAVVERLIQKGRLIAFTRYGREPDRSLQDMLAERLCAACEFHERDCDFAQDREARPCGGFVLLSQLLAAGELTIDDV